MRGPLSPHLGRQTRFFSWKKNWQPFLVITHRQLSVSSAVCHPYSFSAEKNGDRFGHHCRFYSFHSLTRVSPIIPGMLLCCNTICRSSCGDPFFWGGVVQPNMLNMPKSAAGQNLIVLSLSGPLRIYSTVQSHVMSCPASPLLGRPIFSHSDNLSCPHLP